MEIGLRGGWAEFQDAPLHIPRVQLAPHLRSSASSSESNSLVQNSPLPEPEHADPGPIPPAST